MSRSKRIPLRPLSAPVPRFSSTWRNVVNIITCLYCYDVPYPAVLGSRAELGHVGYKDLASASCLIYLRSPPLSVHALPSFVPRGHSGGGGLCAWRATIWNAGQKTACWCRTPATPLASHVAVSVRRANYCLEFAPHDVGRQHIPASSSMPCVGVSALGMDGFKDLNMHPASR